MTSKAWSAGLLAIGLIVGGGATLAHYAAAESTSTTAITTTSTGTNDKENDPADTLDNKDQTEMDDTTEAALSPAQKAAHDSKEAEEQGQDKNENDQETQD